MTFTIDEQQYEVAEHVWRDHPNRIGLVTIDRIRETIESPERTGHGAIDRIKYWKWFPDISARGNYLRVVVDPVSEPRIVVSASPDRSERRRSRRS